MDNRIPKILHSYSTGEQFTHCVDCEKFLLDDEVTYFIEKAIRQYRKEGYMAKDVLFEYAICVQCAEQVRDKMSISSRNAMENYMMKNRSTNVNKSSKELCCIIKGESIENDEEYQMFTVCQGNHMVTTQPVVIGADALEELSELISIETKEELDQLANDFFGPPPELEELLPSYRIPILV